MPRHLTSDAHEWINEIPTVSKYTTNVIIIKLINIETIILTTMFHASLYFQYRSLSTI